VKNTTVAPLTISSIEASANFNVASTTCGAILGADETCTVSVTFTPAQTGVLTGTLSVSDDAANSPQTANLKGTGE